MTNMHRLFLLFLTIVSTSFLSMYTMEQKATQSPKGLQKIQGYLKNALDLAPDEEDEELEKLVLRMVNFVLEEEDKIEENKETRQLLKQLLKKVQATTPHTSM